MSSDTRLAAKVKATNRAHAEALRLYPLLKEVFAPLVGSKVLKVGGGLLEKINSKLGFLPHDGKTRTWHIHSEYSLDFGISCNEQVGEFSCVYAEKWVCVGRLNKGVLVELANPPQVRTDYTVEEIEKAREEYKRLKKMADESLSSIYPFGEYDR